MLMDVEEIKEYLPQRYPFLLVDRILEMDLGKSIVGLKNITANEPFFVGHFPGQPIMPGCLLYTSPSPRDVEESRMPSSA